MIKAGAIGDTPAMSAAEAVAAPSRPAPGAASDAARLRALVTGHFDFVWRSLIRLGVPRADAEDALQQVFLVASRRLAEIEEGRERAFLFGTALRIASRARRAVQRRREVLGDDGIDPPDSAPGAEELVDRARARAELEALLDRMPLELRAVFVLFELEQMTMAEIAVTLDLPPGTVASRLRRARESFQAAIRRRGARP